jgi:pimeloyl-ACP methyl ester carboxylesterase
MKYPHPLLLLPCFAATCLADGPADNLAQNVRPVPPVGIEFPLAQTQPLTEQAQALAAEANKLAPKSPRLPDVLIFSKAVDWALQYKELYDPKQLETAQKLLTEGQSRLEQLRNGQTPWDAASGLVARAYRSKIDRSIQPYGLVIPKTWSKTDGKKWPLHVWFHGRAEKMSELDFLDQRMTKAGEFAPDNAIVLHPYSRFCNGQRFAGETDFWEALADVKAHYAIDDERISVRGFSLGGAACWHIGAHHPSSWVAVNPGAGFSETEEFLNFFQNETLQPYPWERKLWNLYDSTAVPANFRNTNLIAYSGELDKQKQAADAMAKALAKEGMPLQHIIGPQTPHKYEEAAKKTVAAQLDTWQAAGRVRKFDAPLTFTTYSLKYPSTHWATLLGLEEHWKEARISFAPGGAVTTSNVAAVRLDLPADLKLTLDGQPAKNGPWHKTQGKWNAGEAPAGLKKTQDLQGPIDDAFMAPFLFVKPTGKYANEAVKTWCEAELARAEREWRRHFRGEVRSKLDTEITSDEMKTYHLILWGDFQSNSVLAKLLPKTPVQWNAEGVTVGQTKVPADHHAPVCIYPNPLQPQKYIVVNTSFTFREYDYLNNARQTPKLPDWAILDLKEPPNSRFAGKIVTADFFDEAWQVK